MRRILVPVVLGGAAWSPRQAVEGVKPFQWFDASQETAYAADAAVDTLTDRGSAAANLTAATTARPTFKVGIQNGKPALLFDGSANAMATAAAVNFSDTSKVTHFLVIKPTTQATSNYLYSLNAGSNDGFENYHDTGGKITAYVTGNVGTSYHVNTTVINGTTVYVTIIQDLSVSNDNVLAYVNGVTAGAPTLVNNTNSFSNRVTYLGKRFNGTGFYKGYMMEILTYKATFTAAGIATVEKYLKSKWGL